MKTEMIDELEQIFKLLGNRTRLKIITLLREHAYNVKELVATLEMEQSAVSHQLKLLREAQLVQTTKRGRTVYYYLADSHILILLDNALIHMDHVRRHEECHN
ncbi:ArsR/SmtB family transcription factor [Weissella kandleri]|uniref:ArsR/SmtB family transcription factor n=1 Tax=Weissella kandleri TaxID=1616 RepID=UPI00387EAAFA